MCASSVVYLNTMDGPNNLAALAESQLMTNLDDPRYLKTLTVILLLVYDAGCTSLCADRMIIL